MLQDKHFIQIAKKYASDTATKAEQQQVETFYASMQERHKYLPINLSSTKKLKIKKDIDGVVLKKGNQFSFKIIAMAASILVLMSIGLGYSVLYGGKTTTISALKGERKEILLADGSNVFLNANSSISYKENFTDKRNIILKGEAFFKVARDIYKPFTVTSNNTKTQVVGTSFNINSNNTNKTIISVNTGKVLVCSKTTPENKIVLTKNQQVEFLNNIPSKVNSNDSDDLMAWTKNSIVLNNETLKNTAKILENWYDVSIDFNDKDIQTETISGKFNNETLNNVLQSIALLKNLKIDYVTSNQITIRKNKEIE